MLHLPKWILKKQSEQFLLSLIETKAQVDETTDKQIRRVLWEMRYERAIAPYLAIFKLAWETISGRYRKSFTKVRGNTDSASGGGAGAAGQPVTQYSGIAGFTGNPLASSFSTTSPGGIVSMPPPNPAPYFEDVGIRAGEVVAYRGWALKDNGHLYSIFQSGFRWEPGKVMEGDAEHGHGIHGFKSLLLLAEYCSGSSCATYVTGTVYLWGEVYEHERGYRASKAAIRSIDDSPHYDAKALRKLYGLNKRRKKK